MGTELEHLDDDVSPGDTEPTTRDDATPPSGYIYLTFMGMYLTFRGRRLMFRIP